MKQKKHLLSVLAFVFLSMSSFAQFSAGLDAGLPMGSFGDIANTGFGLSVRYEAPIKDKLNWTGSVGFLSFGGKNFLGGAFGATSIIPVVGGIKYYFNDVNGGFYGAADIGFNFISYSVAFPNSGNGQGVTFGTASTTNFGIAPGIGFRKGSWDFSGRFNMVSDFNWLGLRAAYIFGAK